MLSPTTYSMFPNESEYSKIDNENKIMIRKLIVVNDKVILGIITVNDISRATKDIVKRVMATSFLEETEAY